MDGRLSLCRVLVAAAARRVRPLAAAVALLVLVLATPAVAAGPVLNVSKQAPATQLYGTQAEVRVTASVPAGDPGGPGYNLTLRDVLPPGVTYVAGSTTGSAEPRIIHDAPGLGQTTLIWSNIADVFPGSQVELGYRVGHRTIDDPMPHLQVQDTYTNSVTGYVNTNPRDLAKFAADGAAIGGSYSSSGVGSATTRLTAIRIDKSEPSPEAEILRGAHDQQTVYTLTVTNNSVRPTSTITADDYLPAGLEYLQCGAGDNSATEEYPGSGPLNPGNAPSAPDCRTPAAVETIEADPDGIGPLPFAVYTHVSWAVPDLAAAASYRVQYVAAIPIRENTATWPGPPPAPAGLGQGSNLDNNTGAETQDEQALTNLARAAGLFNGVLAVQDTNSLTRTAEDIRLLKSVDTATIVQGQLSTWTLRIDTSEYRSAQDIAVTDTLPNGLCPVDASSNHEHTPPPAAAECDPIASGDLPAAFGAYTGAVEQADGSWVLSWDQTTVPALAAIARNGSLTFRFKTRTRGHYQQSFADSSPVLGRDRWRNLADLAATTELIDGSDGQPIDHDGPLTATDVDSSFADQSAGSGAIAKQVATRAMPVDCQTAAYSAGPATGYRPGDRICWKLRVDFPAGLDTGGATVSDFLPQSTTYDAGSAQLTAGNTVGNATLSVGSGTAGDVLTWTIDDSGGFTGQNRVFEVIFSSTLDRSNALQSGDILANLMKMSFVNTAGNVYGLREEADFEYTPATLELTKGVMRVDGQPAGGNPANTDHRLVAGGSVVQWRIDLTNPTAVPVHTAEIWDPLPAGFTCSDISDISDGGECDSGRVHWDPADAVAVPANGSTTLTYKLTLPPQLAPGFTLTNHAGVRSYRSSTNITDPGEDEFIYYPASNIDPSVPAPNRNAAAADDVSDVYSASVGFAKSIVSSELSEGGNNGTNQATIGEEITWRIRVTIPEGTTVFGDPLVSDPISTRLIYTAASAAATFDGDGAGPGAPGSLPGGFTLSDAGGTIKLQFPNSYTNAPGSGDDIFEITFKARVADVAANGRGSAVQRDLPNSATFAWQDGGGGPHTENAAASAQVVEPLISLAKSEDDADDVVSPGQTLRYRLNLTNSGDSYVSTAHDLVVTDVVPAGLTPLGPGAVPVSADGDTVVNPLGTPAGVWNETTRTITWTVASLDRNTSAAISYDAVVPLDNNAGSTFTNSAKVTVTSMPGASAHERTAASGTNTGYSATATNTVSLVQASTAKSVSPTGADPGQQVTYTVDVTLPAGVRFYDTTVLDRLPDGVDFDGLDSIICTVACSPPVSGSLIEAHAEADGSTTLGFHLGDAGLSTAVRTVRIVYRAHIDSTYTPEGTDVVAGDVLTNTARTYYNGTDVLGPPLGTNPGPGDFTNSTGPAQSSVTVTEPHIMLDKTVSGDADADDARGAEPGDSFTYSVAVHNDGTSTAYDVEVTDQPSALLTNVVLAGGAALATDTWTQADPDIRWVIPSIAAGATVTLTYTADLIASSALHQGDTAVNTADVPVFYGLPSVDRTPGGDWRTYTDTPADTVTVTVHLPELDVQKYTGSSCESSGAPAYLNQPLAWCIDVTNTDTVSTLHDVDVVDALPVNWQYVAGSATSDPSGLGEPVVTGTTASGRVLTWTDAFDLGPGEGVRIHFTATPLLGAEVDPGSGPSHPHENTATATGDDASGSGSSADGPYSGTGSAEAILRLPALAITKLPDGGTATAGSSAQWTVSVANNGDGPANGLVIGDVLPAGVTYTPGSATVSFTPSGAGSGFSEESVTTDTPTAGRTTVVWTLDTLDEGGKVTITVPVTVAPSVAAGTTLTNSASVFSDEIPAPLLDDGSLTVATSAGLSVLKSDGGATATAGSPLDYTVTAANAGPSDAQNVIVDDVIAADLTPRPPLPAGCTFTDATRLLRCTRTTLASGASWALALSFDVSPSATATIVNTATVGSDTPDPDTSDNSSTETTPLVTSANLRLTKTASPATILEGGNTTYTLTVVNDGPSDALAVELTDTVPAGLDVWSVTGSAGSTCDEPTPNAIQCTLGTVPAASTRVVTVQATGLVIGSHDNSATVTASTPDPDTGDNSDAVTVTVLPAADLSLTKSGPATVEAGGRVSYELTVRNAGPSPAQDAVVTDTLPVGAVYDDAASDPACDASGGSTVVCPLGALAVGAERTLTITVTVPISLAGTTIINNAVVGAATGDPDTTNNSDDHQTQVGTAADLSIVKSQSTAVAGSPLTYTLIVRNAGPSDEPRAVVADTLPEGLTLRSASPSQGACELSGGTVSCSLGLLAAGGSAQVVIVTDVPSGAAGTTITNSATVSGDAPDPDPANNSSTVSQLVVDGAHGQADLELVKRASTATPQLGRRLTYTLTVTNRGPHTATDAVVSDTMSTTVQVDAVRGPNCVVTGSTVRCTIAKLAVGETTTIEIDVTPTTPGSLRNTANVAADQPNPSAGTPDDASVDAVGVTVKTRRGVLSVRKRAIRRNVTAGRTARFAITVQAARAPLAGVKVCDRLPAGLSLRSAPGAKLVRGQICWQVGYLRTGSAGRRTFTLVARVGRGARGTHRNTVIATAKNAASRRARAAVRVRGQGVRSGGVTG